MRRRILIVEDDPAICDAYRLALEQEGYEVAVAEHGGAALAKLRDGAPLPHLILLDLMMPVMNGWEFLEARRADRTLRVVPVVALTCGSGTAPVEEADATLDKPMDLSELTTLVRKYCAGAVERPGN
ncbi:MAG: response regulator [Gammaproteobacteria bacterium]